MRILHTIIAIISSQILFSQQTYFVTQTGNGSKNGSSWENASDDLSKIVDGAKSGDNIWVSTGTYQGGFYMKEGVSVYGGFSGNERQLNERKMPGTNENLTILDGNNSYRVLTQSSDFSISTVWDGFIIQNGSSQNGGGVYLRKNGIVRRCIIKNNSTAMPAIGDYIPQEGGVIFQVNKDEKKVWIISEEDCGRNYHIYYNGNTNINNIEDAILDMNGKINTYSLAKSRATQAIQAFRGGGQSDWYIPSAGEWARFIERQGDGSFKQTKTYELVEASLSAYGKTPLSGKKYWSSTSAEHNGMASVWYINFQNDDIQKVNIWQYNHIRGIRYYTITSSDGKGGGVFALDGSRIEGCLLTKNQSSMGSAICARGDITILNSTIVDNKLESSSYTSSAIDGNSVVKVYNTVVAGNLTATGGSDKYIGAPYYAYSAVESSVVTAGEANVLVNNVSELGFVDVTAKNYRLTTSSILAEKGNINYLPIALYSDLVGNNRVSNNKVSVGAYQQDYVSNINNKTDIKTSIYPNPVKTGSMINVDFNSLESDALVEVYDMFGRIISTDQGNVQLKIQSPKSAGIYLLRITLPSKVISEYKLVVI